MEPENPGVAERYNCTLGEGITAMLREAGLPLSFWGEALAALVHVLNRVPLLMRPPVLPMRCGSRANMLYLTRGISLGSRTGPLYLLIALSLPQPTHLSS